MINLDKVSYLEYAYGTAEVYGTTLSTPTFIVFGYPRDVAVSNHSNYRLLVHPTINVNISDVKIGFLRPPLKSADTKK